MSNLGQLVTELICDASNYTKGTDQARAGNKALGGSIDQIIGGLDRQKKALDKATQTTQGNIVKNAADGADPNKVNEALRKLNEVEAIKKQRQAQDEATAARIRGKQAGESLIATLEKEKATVGMTTAQLRIYNAVQAGASQEDIRRVHALNDEIAALHNARNAQSGLAGTTGLAANATGGFSRNSMILTEATRGLEDAVSGFTNNGLKGMLQATTNNVNQIGALTGGNLGLILSFGSIAALIGVSLVPKLIEWANDTSKVTAEKERLLEVSKRLYDYELKQAERLADSNSKLKSLRSNFAEDTRNARSTEQIDAERQAKSRQQAELDGVIAREAAKQAALLKQDKRADQPITEFQPRPINNMGGGIQDWMHMANVTGFETTQQAKDRKAFEDRLRETKEQYRQSVQIKEDAEKESLLLGTQFADLERQQEVARIRERNAGLQELKANEREALDAMEADRKAKLSAQLGDMRAFASQLEGNIKAISPKMGEEHDIEKRRKQIEIDRERGLINQQEADVLNRANVMKPDGPSGNAAAIQAGTKEAYSSIVKSMRANEQVKYQQEQAELAKDQLKILEKIEGKIKATDETVLVDFP